MAELTERDKEWLRKSWNRVSRYELILASNGSYLIYDYKVYNVIKDSNGKDKYFLPTVAQSEKVRLENEWRAYLNSL